MITKAKAEKIAKEMFAKRASAFISGYSIASYLNLDKKVSDNDTKKVLEVFLPLVAGSSRYTMFDRMYAEEQVKKMKKRKNSKNL